MGFGSLANGFWVEYGCQYGYVSTSKMVGALFGFPSRGDAGRQTCCQRLLFRVPILETVDKTLANTKMCGLLGILA